MKVKQDHVSEEQATNEHLNELLVSWHIRSKHYAYGKDYPSTSVSCKDWRSSRQYDDENGALDTDIHASTIDTLNAEIYAMPHPHQDAIHIQARNLYTGKSVWMNPRLPVDPVQRVQLLAAARKMLIEQLAKRGIVV